MESRVLNPDNLVPVAKQQRNNADGVLSAERYENLVRCDVNAAVAQKPLLQLLNQMWAVTFSGITRPVPQGLATEGLAAAFPPRVDREQVWVYLIENERVWMFGPVWGVFNARKLR
jgi:hypothetical protein